MAKSDGVLRTGTGIMGVIRSMHRYGGVWGGGAVVQSVSTVVVSGWLLDRDPCPPPPARQISAE